MSEPVSRDNKRMGCLLAALDVERELARRGSVPDLERLIHTRVRPAFEIIGAILLALGITSMALLGNFLVFNMILHWTF